MLDCVEGSRHEFTALGGRRKHYSYLADPFLRYNAHLVSRKEVPQSLPLDLIPQRLIGLIRIDEERSVDWGKDSIDVLLLSLYGFFPTLPAKLVAVAFLPHLLIAFEVTHDLCEPLLIVIHDYPFSLGLGAELRDEGILY